MVEEILQLFLPDAGYRSVRPFGKGLINHTWEVVTNDGTCFILQRINTAVFRDPGAIAGNIRNIGAYLQKQYPGYLFIAPLRTLSGEDLVSDGEGGYFRLFPYVRNSRSIDVVANSVQAYEASRQFALFTRVLSGFDAASLRCTLPDFHNLDLRYRQFLKALSDGNPGRLQQCQDLTDYLVSQKEIVDVYVSILRNPAFKKRVTHHDTKISNVLFDPEDKGMCVIDLDTVMPGYFISDVGDMMRTYLPPVDEDDVDTEKVFVREDIFEAIAAGYLGIMKEELSPEETAHFVYAGKFMVYMQSLRFITDYFHNDLYYTPRYEGHNYDRAKNQAVLLQKIIGAEPDLEKIVAGALRGAGSHLPKL